jgi:hypothetical protein
MKPVIKIWCLPLDLTQKEYRNVQQTIVKVVESFKDFKLKGEESMIVLFPQDLMEYGLGTEIVIEGTSFPARGISLATWEDIAKALCVAIKRIFSEAHVQSTVGTTNSTRSSFFISAK